MGTAHMRLMSFLAIGFIFSGCAGSPDIGLTDGHLKPCPDSPNCVTSRAETDTGAYVPPFAYAGSRQQARSRLLSILESMHRSRIVTADPNYIHAEFRSRLFRFVDDVEFFFPETARIIEVRSAARSGYYDFGVNRKRVEEIRHLFQEAEGRSPQETDSGASGS